MNQESRTSSAPQRVRRLLRFAFLCLFLFLLLAGTGGFLCLFYLPIHPEKAGSTQLLIWMSLRSLDKEPPEIQRAILARAEEICLSDTDISSQETEKSRKELKNEQINEQKGQSKKELPVFIQSLVKKEQKKHQEKVHRWQQQNNGWRLLPEYRCETAQKPVPRNQNQSVQLSPFLEKETRFEKNLSALSKIWFLEKSRQCQALTDTKKKQFLDETLKTLNRWDDFYGDVLTSVHSGSSGLFKRLAEFSFLQASWKNHSSRQEIAELYWFCDQLIIREIEQTNTPVREQISSLKTQAQSLILLLKTFSSFKSKDQKPSFFLRLLSDPYLNKSTNNIKEWQPFFCFSFFPVTSIFCPPEKNKEKIKALLFQKETFLFLPLKKQNNASSANQTNPQTQINSQNQADTQNPSDLIPDISIENIDNFSIFD